MPVTKSRKMARTRRKPLRRKSTTRRKAVRRQRGGVNETLYLNATQPPVLYDSLSIYDLEGLYQQSRQGTVNDEKLIKLIKLSVFKSREQDDASIASKITSPDQYNFFAYSYKNRPMLCEVVKLRLTQTLDAILSQLTTCNPDVIIETCNYILIDLLKGDPAYARKGGIMGLTPDQFKEDYNTVLAGLKKLVIQCMRPQDIQRLLANINTLVSLRGGYTSQESLALEPINNFKMEIQALGNAPTQGR